jgi:hypothetical protein
LERDPKVVVHFLAQVAATNPKLANRWLNAWLSGWMAKHGAVSLPLSLQGQAWVTHLDLAAWMGTVDLEGTSLTKLPDRFWVKETLNLRGTPIHHLPRGLHAMTLRADNTDLRVLPAKLDVENLSLRGCRIAELPPSLSLRGDLDLTHAPIQALPLGLTVGRDLILEDTQLAGLPARMSVGRNLYAKGTPITDLPDDLAVERHLDLAGTAITTLPAFTQVGGCLDLRACATWDGRIPPTVTVKGLVLTDGHPHGVALDAWHRAHPLGEHA